ncbi:hypothetical protein CAOG_08566 [Capsaspora owczarzaki ATCC 30864]|uniref:Endo-beta-1,2-glucanase SGL domain-containing protein n=1 Tax=Capsaspora owczarzaki (strain ATCC 30864) TaxID=595528 RepID=A0A0D2U6E7_CAPO3|nr:hypothetical protein CAOG_08566 [Capsaspora owczarzaki ATCC 30864]KJE90716.1 hypothetical protein CAOG_008566 [Capsaspora owczarzaki ATCC 30864]|eukprot:XP_011270148.1 hypothetical protein CAOG_08566 [Capsaspora owczarzaki ATCC 30864]
MVQVKPGMPLLGLVSVATLLLLLLGAPSEVAADSACRFAGQYTTSQIYSDASLRAQFVSQWLSQEANFVRHAGVDPLTGLTLDGQRLDVKTGLPLGLPHQFTAASKESLHLAILARVLWGDGRASVFYSVDEALQVLDTKMTSLEKFAAKYPGFAGFLPWVYVVDGELTPTDDFVNKVPALDNGEMFWGAFAVAEVLRDRYPAQQPLQARWENFWQTMANNSARVFYNGNGLVRAVTVLTNQSLPPSMNTYSLPPGPCVNCFLTDPYEGELFVIMMYVFGGLTNIDGTLLWANKAPMIQPVDLQIPQSNATFTVQRGWWFSSHETWKYMMLPYVLSPTNYRVFLNGERARTHFSANSNPAISGLFASVSGWAATNDQDTGYFSDCGIQQIAFNNVTHDMLVTPYGAFPVILASQPEGFAWLHNMISAQRGQNCFGTTESMLLNGSYVSPLVTWDSKITTVVAALGGISDITEWYLGARGKLSDWTFQVEVLWSQAFTLPLKGEDLPYALPQSTIPVLADDFTSCSASSSPCVFKV